MALAGCAVAGGGSASSAAKENPFGLQQAGTLRVRTLTDAPPNVFLKDGKFTGFDNDLFTAVAAELGLKVEFVGTDFSGLLAQVKNKKFDLGSSSITITDARKKTVAFTNGYDFGYFGLDVPAGSDIKLRTLRETFLDLDSMGQALSELITVGLPNTLILALCSAVVGTVVGMVLAVCGLSRSRWLRWPARIYTDIFRGLPAAVTILLIDVGLAPLELVIWGPNPYPLGILALSLIASAYIGEIFRSGIQSVEAGQIEAARALGFSQPSLAPGRHPAGCAQGPASRDLFRIGQDQAANTGNESGLLLAGLFYLVITVPLTHVVNLIDSRLRNGRLGNGNDAR